MASIRDVRFEHYRPQNTLGVDETKPRISWKYDSGSAFRQRSYKIEVAEEPTFDRDSLLGSIDVASSVSNLVPWPIDQPLRSRQRVFVRVQGVSAENVPTAWSEAAVLETGIINWKDWQMQRITCPWTEDPATPQAEKLFRKLFDLKADCQSARLYITSQGVYEAEINGKHVGDFFLAPGWTEYNDRLQYQTYDVSDLLVAGKNCVGVRVAEGWYNGRIGFEGGRRNLWGNRNTLMAQLEMKMKDGTTATVVSDGSWSVATGPTQLAEIYDGEKYDATKEVDGWSTARSSDNIEAGESIWSTVEVLDPLPTTTKLVTGFGEPVRRIEVIKPVNVITTVSGKRILDFGQNVVGYVRIKSVRGPRGQTITLTHAEVLERGEIGTRPLRHCKAIDEYIIKGSESSESWEPRFTFHGFRYVQVEGCPEDAPLIDSIEAVVCHTDMERVGHFECSDDMINQLYRNICWSMRGNFLSVPMDCPQRDERLGWTGDLALFAPTATLIYQCAGILKNWLADLALIQERRGGLPPLVVPDAIAGDPKWDMGIPCGIWHDVAVIGPWVVYNATGDADVLRTQYTSMQQWLGKIVRFTDGRTPNLWDPKTYQMGDWLDPTAPPHAPWQSKTDSKLAADAFLVQSIRLMSQVARIIGKEEDALNYNTDFIAAREQFQAEWTSPNGRMVCESQTAYALALCFDILSPDQRVVAGERLSEIVRLNAFKIGTGFVGTPYICEALAQTGHGDVAYAMLLNQECPSWLYPVSMGATTTWERWDSMLPDGSINPGEMTSFNHYAFGAVAVFLHERLAGLSCAEPGWNKVRVEPLIGANLTWASTSHMTPYGRVSVSWKIVDEKRFKIDLEVPQSVTMEMVIPDGAGKRQELLGCGKWSFETEYKKTHEWPISALSALPF